MKICDETIPEFEKLIIIYLKAINRIFGSLTSFFSGISETRHESYIDYSQPSLFFTAMLLFSFRLEARNKIKEFLRTPNIHAIFQQYFNCNVPDGDTINNAFSMLAIEEVSELNWKAVRRLIDQKYFYDDRIFGEYFLIAIDGTGLHSYSERHCPHCLKRTINGKTVYMHYVLEAKLISKRYGEYSVSSIFVENEHEEVTKQDCELKAFYRLAEELKIRFPRTKLLLTFDALYAKGPVFNICQKNNWKYMVILKNPCLPSVHEEFVAISSMNLQDKKECINPKNEANQKITWANDISYKDTENRIHNVNVVDCLETLNGNSRHWRWITNIKIQGDNVKTIVNDAGRLRWGIEDAFNTQKNRGFALKHQYSRDIIAAKVFYYVLQIAHMLSQVIEAEKLLKEWFPKGFSSAKALFIKMLEAFRNYSSLKMILNFIRRGNLKAIENTS
jgi:hypothetical protein